MAISKEIIKENGIVSNYHKISSITLSTFDDDNRLTILIDSFFNKEYRNKNCAIDNMSYVFSIKNSEDENLSIRALGYKKLKELEIFKDAVDC